MSNKITLTTMDRLVFEFTFKGNFKDSDIFPKCTEVYQRNGDVFGIIDSHIYQPNGDLRIYFKDFNGDCYRLELSRRVRWNEKQRRQPYVYTSLERFEGFSRVAEKELIFC